MLARLQEMCFALEMWRLDLDFARQELGYLEGAAT